jgi:hypothetical protein
MEQKMGPKVNELLDLIDELLVEYIDIDFGEHSFPEWIEESIWKPSPMNKNWLARVDRTPHPHVHVVHKKHLNDRGYQRSWDQSGHRYHELTFNTDQHGIKTAKRVARQALGLPADTVLEHKISAMKLALLEIGSMDISTDMLDIIYYFEVV